MEWYYIVLIVVGALILFYFSLSYFYYRKLLIDFNRKDKKLVDHDSSFYKESYEWFQNIPKEDVYIRSYDNLKLHGYYIPALDKNSSNLAIVIHGYQSKATDMIIIGKLYSDLGFKVLMIDLRAHGLSEGKFTSIGHYEKYDLKKWLNFALRNYGANNKLLIHGVSMGAVMAMLVTELKIKNNLRFLVLDSGFTTFKKSLAATVRPKFLKIFFFGISFFTYIFHRYTLGKIKPINAMKKITTPLLIIHGSKDKPVPLSMAEELYQAAKTTKKDLVIVNGASHAKGFEVEKDFVVDKILVSITDIFNIKKSNIKSL